MDFHMFLLLFHHAMDVVCHMLSLLSFKEQRIYFSMCSHSTLICNGWIFICCNHCFTMQWMCSSTCCHWSLSKNNGYCFLSVVTEHLISSRWISICCYCCFTMEWMWFFICCHCSLSKNNGCCLFSLCCHRIFNKQRMYFDML